VFETYDLTGTLDGLALLDQSVGTEKHNTDLAGFEVHAHALDAGGEPEVDVSLGACETIGGGCILDKLLSLDIAHAVHTRNTVTFNAVSLLSIFRIVFHLVPDREDTAGLGETSLLLHTADPLLEDGGDLGRGGLSIGGIAACEGVHDSGRGALLRGEKTS